MRPQPAILAQVTASARFLSLDLRTAVDPRPALDRLRSVPLGARAVVGIGAPLASLLGARLAGLRAFPEGFPIFPTRQHALWLGFLDDDRGASFDDARHVYARVRDAFTIVEEIETFVYRGGRDLSGYVDGTENPTGDAAETAALVAKHG